jgi:hypothetical protein
VSGALNDKTLAKFYVCPFSSNYHPVERQNARQFLPVSILFKFPSCWTTKRSPILIGVHFTQILIQFKDSTLAKFYQCPFYVNS